MKKVILKKDFIIPAGTIFECCDGLSVNYASDNFESMLGIGKNSTLTMYIEKESCLDKPDQFEFIKD